jgi:uncharacterized protein YecA (UPF0149 family)
MGSDVLMFVPVTNLDGELFEEFARESLQLPEPVVTKREPIRNVRPVVGRNAPCPCGSGLKFKKCRLPIANHAVSA